VSLATVKKPASIDVFIKARGKSLRDLAVEIASHVAPAAAPARLSNPSSTSSSSSSSQPQQKFLILIDNLNPLLSTTPHLLPTFFSSIIPPSTTSLVAVYHTDVPSPRCAQANPYSPSPLTMLTHIATAILRVSSLHHAAETKRANDRSLVPPEWGLNEGREGVLVGLRSNQTQQVTKGGAGIVVDMELRRKSGRVVAEKFILVSPPPPSQQQRQEQRLGSVMLLSDHPIFAATAEEGDGKEEGEGMETSFNLGLTEKQRRDRDGVVLPYFDAQTEVGGGEGGRILYDIGSEDDFDEEEDEI